MMSETDQVLAIPLWINGHAYLTMAKAFYDVRDAATSEVKRRTPLCGAAEALSATASAKEALAPWVATSANERARLLAALADALAEYDEHFAGLISEETGKDAATAAGEVSAALNLLRTADPTAAASDCSTVVAVVSDDREPLLGPLRHAVAAFGPCRGKGSGEQSLARQLWDDVPAGSLGSSYACFYPSSRVSSGRCGHLQGHHRLHRR